MPGKVDLSGREILILLVNGFESFNIGKLMECFQSMGAAVKFASFNEGDNISSADGDMNVQTKYSFADAAQSDFDAVIVADKVTARAIRENPAAMNTVERTWAAGRAVGTVDEGALVLVGAGIADKVNIAAPDDIRDDIVNAGAEMAGTPISFTGNIITAGPGANLDVFCRDIGNFIVSGKEMAA